MSHWAVAFGILVSAGAAHSQTIVAEFAGTSIGDEFGIDFDVVPDVDGDGRPELLIGAPQDDSAGPGFGRAVILASTTGQSIATFDGQAAQEHLGRGVACIGYRNFDGFPDVALGVPGVDSASGEVRILSGATGQVLDVVAWPYENEEFGDEVEALGDLDQDGVSEFAARTAHVCGDLVGCPFLGNGIVYSGATGAEKPGFIAGYYFRTAGRAGGGTHTDYLTWRNDEEYGAYISLCSGGTGQELDGMAIAGTDDLTYAGGPAADLDGDGRAEYVFVVKSGLLDETTLRVNSLRHGTLKTIHFESEDSGRIVSVDGTADMDGDGSPDLVLGVRSPSASGTSLPDAVVFVTLDGTRLGILDETVLDDLGQVRVIDDWSGDGIADVAVSWLKFSEPGRVQVVSMAP